MNTTMNTTEKIDASTRGKGNDTIHRFCGRQRTECDESTRERLVLSLSLPQEQTIRQRVQEQQDQVAKERLVHAYLPLIRTLAGRYATNGVPEEDIAQEGVLILLEALQDGIHLPAATFRASIKRRLMLHLETYVQRNASLEQEASVFQKEHEAFFSSNNSLHVQLLSEFQHPSEQEPLLSLDVPWSVPDEETRIDDDADDAETLYERVRDPFSMEEQMLLEERNALLLSVVTRLTRRQQTVLIHRFGLNGHAVATLEQVGRLLGVGRERVRQIEDRALRLLRRGLRTSWQQDAFQYFKDYMKDL